VRSRCGAWKARVEQSGGRRRLASAVAAAALVALAGCGDDEREPVPGLARLDEGDTLVGQGVEIEDGRFVPKRVAVDAAQPVNFVNRDDATHRIVKVSGPGRSFRSEPLEPGERYRLSLLGKPGSKLREGTVVYRSTGPGRPIGLIAVTGMLLRRPDDPAERPPEWATAPARPDLAATRRARQLAEYVSQCRDFRRCDTGAELVRNVGSGNAVSFVPGSRGAAVESAVSTHGPSVRLGSGPDETEIEATRNRFTIVSHSRTGRDFVIRGSERDPDSWSTGWRPAR
jgi:plastocyanin